MNRPDLPDFPLVSTVIAAQAEVLEKALEAWPRSLPDDWTYSTVSDAQGGESHTYATQGHATVWNRYRATRLITNSIRMRTLGSLLHHHRSDDPSMAGKHRSSIGIIETLAKDLHDSVPSFFSKRPSRFEELADSGLVAQQSDEEPDILPKMAMLLAWPLTVAVSTEGISSEQRVRLQQRLKLVGSALGDGVLEAVSEKREFKF